MTTLTVSEWAEGALLKVSGLRLIESRFNPQTRRVEFDFEDPSGVGEEIIVKHNQGNLRVTTLDFVQAERWIKRLTHETKGKGNTEDNTDRGVIFNGNRR